MPLPAADPKDLDVRRCALLVSPFEDPAAQALVPALQRIYGMTPSEALLTEALVSGRSLAQVAEERAVSIHTVRTQLKAATAKAGAKRQADLVRIILTGPAMRTAR
jgi:DNA-binding CsgD family transcriptional regulator